MPPDCHCAGLDCSNWTAAAGGSVSGGWDVINHPCYVWTFIESFWWSLMTITTVGYELNPKSLLGLLWLLKIILILILIIIISPCSSPGKMIGGCCALSGVFILTLPIPIVVNSFAVFYKNRLWRNEVEHKKKEKTMQLAAEKKEMQKKMMMQTLMKTVYVASKMDNEEEGKLQSPKQ